LDIDYINIGKRIASRRDQLHLTQAELAEKANIGSKHISSIETATSTPSLAAIMRICSSLEMNADYLLFGVNNQNPDSLMTDILHHLIACNQQELGDILHYIKASHGQ